MCALGGAAGWCARATTHARGGKRGAATPPGAAPAATTCPPHTHTHRSHSPSRAGRSARAGWQRMVKRGAHTLAAPEYQILFVPDAPALAAPGSGAYERLRTIRTSDRLYG